MKIFKYSQARKHLEEGFPTDVKIGDKKIWFTVKDHQVSLEGNLSKEKWNCDCYVSSNFNVNNDVYCSHVLCAIAYLMKMSK